MIDSERLGVVVVFDRVVDGLTTDPTRRVSRSHVGCEFHPSGPMSPIVDATQAIASAMSACASSALTRMSAEQFGQTRCHGSSTNSADAIVKQRGQ